MEAYDLSFGIVFEYYEEESDLLFFDDCI